VKVWCLKAGFYEDRRLGSVERGVSVLTRSLLGRYKRSVCYADIERTRVKGNGHVNTCSVRQSSVYRGATMPILGKDVAVQHAKKRTRRGKQRVND
jgi:hypothetical protein